MTAKTVAAPVAAPLLPVLPTDQKVPVASPCYDTMKEGTAWHALAKDRFAYKVYQADVNHYFQFGIGPLCIFCAAVFSIFWGTLAGLLIKRVNMNDHTGV